MSRGGWFAPGSLRYQILSRSLLILAVILLLIGVFQYVVMQNFLYRNRAETIQSQTRTIPWEAWARNGTMPRREGPGGPPVLSDSTIAFINLDGEMTVLQGDVENRPAPVLAKEEYLKELQMNEHRKQGGYRIGKDEQGTEVMIVLHPVESRGRGVQGLIQVSTATGPIKNVLLRQLLTFIALSALALIIGLLTFLPVLRRVLVPLSRFIDTVERMGASHLKDRLPVNQGQVEIDRLSKAFNGMLERLEHSFEAEKEAKEHMRRFVADASHELRTPLTSIHGFLEVLLRGAVNHPEQLNRALKSMYGESERINKLVQDLLQLAKLDQTPQFEMTDGTLDTVVREMEAQLHLLGGERKIVLQLESGVKARFDKDRIKQVLLNLFHNAVQHTSPESGSIEISVRDHENLVELSVQDNGPGIAEEHLPHLFDRFYRIDTSRARRSGGAGLGLAITKSIAELHGGEIQVESIPGTGTAFRLLLPKTGLAAAHSAQNPPL
ncbi:ATP-binding protein [Paenibacillus sp. GD4]|uniref:sensor histidine kinase n=1 Tax=Paenibacillus sp. GD4 TaxID=3068890 RepID=UPI002796DF42|nr:HAMP domain-containing sensor histidine kinase [Paenibacillus sp. GD4]MDQ1911967.1 ATP-binding protein [Paenibacillus sp. GD4]